MGMYAHIRKDGDSPPKTVYIKDCRNGCIKGFKGKVVEEVYCTKRFKGKVVEKVVKKFTRQRYLSTPLIVLKPL